MKKKVDKEIKETPGLGLFLRSSGIYPKKIKKTEGKEKEDKKVNDIKKEV